MTHIVCRALVCVFWEQGVCSAEEIEYEPDVGCLTFQDLTELDKVGEDGDLHWVEEDEDESFLAEEEPAWDDDQDWDDEEI